MILIPLFNDWTCQSAFLAILDRQLIGTEISAKVLVMGDGSSTTPKHSLLQGEHQALHEVEYIELRRNHGQRRAIAVSRTYTEDRDSCETAVIMDSGSEDDPNDVPHLLQTYHEQACQKIAFVEHTSVRNSRCFGRFTSLGVFRPW